MEKDPWLIDFQREVIENMALLEMHGIIKAFPGVLANDKVELCVEEGQIHAILGENGAGKTTLMNILYGLYQADEGEIIWQGKKVHFASPTRAIESGIGMVHQHFMLVEKMTVLQNIILGLKPAGYPFINATQIAAQINELSRRYGLLVDAQKRIYDLSVGQQQRVEILKALYREAKLLILDEPTAVLTPQETVELFHILRMLKNERHSVILISHRLAEIMEISDVVTVLRNGRNVATVNTADTNVNELSRFMIGRDLADVSLECQTPPGQAVALNAEGLTVRYGREKPVLQDISFALRQGEILGVAGVDGNGQVELAEILCGIQRPLGGMLKFDGKDVVCHGIRARFEEGIAYIPEDRHKDGLVLDTDVKNNLMLRCYHVEPYSKHGVFRRKKVMKAAQELIDAYNIKTPSMQTRVANLSGGNQQKIILAREVGALPKLLVAMQPTRGLDIGATEYVRQQLIECRNSGRSVILISTDLDEIIAMCDRIAVIFEGRLMGIMENTPDLSAETIGLLMGGKTLSEVTA